jgi:site-specific recombinase XerC
VITRAIQHINRTRAKDGTEPLPHWAPNQLRHAAATEIRKAYGLESAQAVLGHSHMNVLEIYAEKNLDLAAEIMRKIG